MKHSSILAKNKPHAGDAAVQGLFNGFIAGIAMAVVLVVLGLAGGVPVGGTLVKFTASPAGNPLVGLLSHLAISGIYGLVFGLAWNAILRWRRLAAGKWRTLLAGSLYGLVLWLAAQWILLPTTAAALGSMPAGQLLLAHLAYGLMLGWLFGRG